MIFTLVKMSGNEFMSEMRGFLDGGGGGDPQFMRPSSSSSKLKLKKEKKSKKEKKAKKEKKKKKDEEDMWVDSSAIPKQTTQSWMGIDEEIFGKMSSVSTRKEGQDNTSRICIRVTSI